MKQPDLGLKVTELRQQKGLTQEQLAEFCEISARTVQRIEGGEVDPRSFTINRLSDVLDFDFGEESEGNEALWLTVLHLSSIIPIVILPLLIWSWKKNKSYKIDKHGRDVLNFQITMMLLMFIAAFILFLAPAFMFYLDPLPGLDENGGTFGWWVLFIPMPLVLVGLFSTFQSVINTTKVLSDRPYKYLLSIPFIR
jgi:uncharacterized Tic20 family protein